MPKTQTKSKRKLTGGLYKKLRKKKKRDFGKDFFPIRLGDKKKESCQRNSKKNKTKAFES